MSKCTIEESVAALAKRTDDFVEAEVKRIAEAVFEGEGAVVEVFPKEPVLREVYDKLCEHFDVRQTHTFVGTDLKATYRITTKGRGTWDEAKARAKLAELQREAEVTSPVSDTLRRILESARTLPINKEPPQMD